MHGTMNINKKMKSEFANLFSCCVLVSSDMYVSRTELR